MTFDEWATAYFGRDVDVPQACRDAWKAGQREALLEAADRIDGLSLGGDPTIESQAWACGTLDAADTVRIMAKELE